MIKHYIMDTIYTNGEGSITVYGTFSEPPMYKSSREACNSTITSSPFGIFSSSSSAPPPPPKKLKRD